MASELSNHTYVYGTRDETAAKLKASLKLSWELQRHILKTYAGYTFARDERVILLMFKNGTQCQFLEEHLDDEELEARLWLIKDTHKRWWWNSTIRLWETDE